MFNSYDLEIGNWVSYKGIPHKLHFISDKLQSIQDKSHTLEDTPVLINLSTGEKVICESGMQSLKPIELTPAMLEKFGFELINAEYSTWADNEKIVYKLYRNIIDIVITDDDRIFKFVSADQDYGWKDVQLFYVHDLQNIFKRITGKDLKIKFLNVIDSTELRIGNLISYKEDIYELNSVTNFPLMTNIATGNKLMSQVNLDVLKSIDLTPEILKKCGFNVVGGHVTKFVLQRDKDKFHFFFNWVNGQITIKEINSNFSGIQEIYIVALHQLQNLIYSITGRELEFKPS